MSDTPWLPDDDDELVEWPEEWLRDAGLLDDDPPVAAPPELPPPDTPAPDEVDLAPAALLADPSEDEAYGDVLPYGQTRAGRREERIRQRRRRRRRVLAVLAVVAMAAMVFGIVRALPLRRGGDVAATEEPSARPQQTTPPQQDTLLLVRQESDDGPAAGVTLLTAGPQPGSNAVVFLPEGTLLDIPGFGTDRLGLAQQYGGVALVEASVENLLGIDIDHSAAVSNSGLAAFLNRTGGLDVQIDERLVDRKDDGTAEVRFEPGAQFLDGERLVEYWQFRSRGESELDSFPRQQLVWGALLQAAQDDGVTEALVAGGVPQFDTSADAGFVASMLQRMADAQDDGALDYTVLPVAPFGARDDDGGITYRPTPEGVRQLTSGPLALSVPSGGGDQAVRVQVLNGVGTPGIGQEVDRRLEGGGFRIVLTDNARSFDFAETIILIYREDEASMDAAREVQRRLGIGTIQVSRQPQSVVDLTIVVGADFAAGDAGDDDPDPTEEQSS